LEDHYRRLRRAIQQARPGTALISWTVNAGRYGHFLHSPRAMPTRLNQVFDLPMQEWWLDETNVGSSVVPAFGVAYLFAAAGDRPCAAEPYLMSRGNPYGTDSFPAHERRTRCSLALASGNILAESLGWPGHDVAGDFRAAAELDPYLTGLTPLPWAAMLVSEQTRQFHAYKDIANRFLPHPLGMFRCALEEHLPLAPLNDWDLTPEVLAKFAVVILPGSAALSEQQVKALREYARAGGGLVATGEASLADELGRPRPDFALADLFGVSFRGRPAGAPAQVALDENFARSLPEDYWKYRAGVARLSWGDHELTRDESLRRLVPGRAVTFKGPMVRVTEPGKESHVPVRMRPEADAGGPLPAVVLRRCGQGKVAYLAAALDAGLWTYAYPYQRRLLARVLTWAARESPPITVHAPMCVQVTHFTQTIDGHRRAVMHIFNGLNTTAGHGLPAAEVPLREEVVPIHGIEVTFHRSVPKVLQLEPGRRPLELRRHGDSATALLPPLGVHFLLAADG
jgi:hypothetical protein